MSRIYLIKSTLIIAKKRLKEIAALAKIYIEHNNLSEEKQKTNKYLQNLREEYAARNKEIKKLNAELETAEKLEALN